ncbi:hypothetical protein JTE90_008525 [Oedothorax gibbosus]|uniref:Minor histocompatibility protein HA-1 n=1 Tax=Oedothorax gibbosus TaxID=931172 RepID=A0AAV6VJG1_9ARAC|nr:hypothetical protein JTE90_008525 [Oedothorax gibbosus]
MKAVTVGYFQLQSTLSAHAPVQFQTLCESSRLYEPGTQYMEFVKRLPQPTGPTSNGTLPFTFESYSSDYRLDKSRKSNGSTESNEDILNHGLLESRLSSDSRDKLRIQQPIKAWGSTSTQPTLGSDSDSMSSCPSNKSQDTSPAASPHISNRKIVHVSSGDELETDHDNVDTFGQARRPCMSKAAETHSFRRLKTPSRCRECDSYVYFHGFECLECGLASHKKCLESLAIQCGRKRLPRKMTTFGVDLITHADESGEEVPYIVHKCIAEIEDKGFCMKGIYRVSGVKSKVEKLCQSFENGAELVDLDGVHPNVVSNVLKLYLRQLPEPLLTYRLYPDFIKVAKDFPSQKAEDSSNEDVVEDLRKLVQRLPSIHSSTLKCLMHHLHRVSEHSNHNNMPPSNLGIVFGPTLLRTSEGSASLSSLIDTVHQTRVIEMLITHAYDIFGPPPKSTSSQKDDACSHKAKAKSVRYRAGKQSLSRTVSASSQASDLEESRYIEVDHRRDGIPDLDDYPIPGYLPTGKAQEQESHHNSDVTHSSDDLLYSTILSDDDYPEILLPSEHEPFKKSPADNPKPEGLLKPCKGILDPRSSLSSSPAVSEASHCSSLLRSTDDESASEAAQETCPSWSTFPVAPPRKSAPGSLQLNPSFLHGAERKSQSESSGVSSAASTSPTGVGDPTTQGDPGNLYTSTAVVTLAGQKSPSQLMRASASSASVMAELRRQFFDLPPPSMGTPPPPAQGLEGEKLTEGDLVECRRDSESSVALQGRLVQFFDLPPPSMGTPPPPAQGLEGEKLTEGDLVECRRDSESSVALQGVAVRPRGSSLPQAITTADTHFAREKPSNNSEIIYSMRTDRTSNHPSEASSHHRDTIDGVTYHSVKVENSLEDSKRRTEIFSVKHMLQNIDTIPPRSATLIDSQDLSASTTTSRHDLSSSTTTSRHDLGSSTMTSLPDRVSSTLTSHPEHGSSTMTSRHDQVPLPNNRQDLGLSTMASRHETSSSSMTSRHDLGSSILTSRRDLGSSTLTDRLDGLSTVTSRQQLASATMTNRRYVESSSTSSLTNYSVEGQMGDSQNSRGSDKLSPNREPRFV